MGGGGGGGGSIVGGALGSLSGGGGGMQMPDWLAQSFTGGGTGGIGGMKIDNPFAKLLPGYGGRASPMDTAGDRPEMAGFRSAQTTKGTLGKNYTVKAGPAVKAGTVATSKVMGGNIDEKGLQANQVALQAMRDRATATGDSPWLKMATQKQGLEELSLRDQAANQAMSGAANARSQLAMKGGLTGGAAERIAMGSSRDMNAARQGIARQGASDRLNLGIADDQTKVGLLSQTAGLDLQNAAHNADLAKFNVGTGLDVSKTNAANTLASSSANASNQLDASKYNSGMAFDANKTNTAANLGQLKDQNTFNAYKYGQDMAGYGAAKSGDAIANGGKKGIGK